MKIDENTKPQDLAQHLAEIPPEVLRKLDHALLYQAREYVQGAESQNKLAAPEHQAFAREATQENPLMALPIALASIAYQPAKALMGQSRSDPSLEQMGAGLTGVAEGLANYSSSKIQAMQKLLSNL